MGCGCEGAQVRLGCGEAYDRCVAHNPLSRPSPSLALLACAVLAKQREKLSAKERKYWFNVIEADTNSKNKHSNAKMMKVIAKKRAREHSKDSSDSEDSD